MVGFLQEVSRDLFAKKGNDIAQCRLIFPSQRAKVAFYQELTKNLEAPIWKPTSMGMNELIASISPLSVPSNIELLSLLYQCYVDILEDQQRPAESFDQFYSWGEIILTDFDAIDKQNLDAEEVLMHVEDVKAIDELFHSHEIEEQVRMFWENSLKQPNDEFIQTWKILSPLYTSFNEKLLQKRWAYSGMQYKNALQHLSTMDTTPVYVFIGFNALNPCEKTICEHLKNKDALFYWDYDDYYMQDSHEAGFFMRDNLKQFGNALKTQTNRIAGRTNIHIYAAESDILQCKLAGNLAKGKTALVLVDEQLLLPCIHSISTDEQTELNITMGYPFRLSATYGWIKDWLDLCVGSNRLEGSSEDSTYFSKDVLQFLDHQAINRIIDGADELKRKILQSRHRIVVPSELFVSAIPTAFERNESGMDLLVHILKMIDEMLLKNADQLLAEEEFETLSFVYEKVQQLKKVIENGGLELSLSMTARLIHKHLFSLNMTLESDRDSDLQIMGFLETRAMDFENTIILSVNEDKLPGNTNSLSFIPFSIRCAFGLPTHKEKEAMYAYYFFRLLQRSDAVHLIYNNSTAYNNTGEMSRYIQQIQMELLSQPIDIQCANLPIRLLKREIKEYQKSGPEWAEFIANPAFSASSLNEYLDCPLRFYFRKIAKYKQTEELISEVDGSVFGNIVHQAMHVLYTPFGDEPIPKAKLADIIANTQLLKDGLNQVYKNTGLSSEYGEGAMLECIFLNFIQRIIRYDKDKRGDFSIHSMEDARELTPMDINIAGESRTIFWNAVFDRVDREHGEWIVVDYKTGTPPKKNKTIIRAEDLFLNNVKGAKEARQALLYSILMEKDGCLNAKPMLYFVQQMHQDQYNAEIEIENTADPIQEFMTQLTEVLNEFFDTSIPFTPCTDSKTCTYCPFIHVCEPQTIIYDA